MNNILEKLQQFKNTLNANQYRFDKKSNFLSYEEWEKDKINCFAEKLVDDYRSELKFKTVSDDSLINILKDFQRLSSKEFVEMKKDIKREYFSSVYEMQRRNLSL